MAFGLDWSVVSLFASEYSFEKYILAKLELDHVSLIDKT